MGAPASWELVTSALPSTIRVMAPALVGHQLANEAQTSTPFADFAGEVRRLVAEAHAAGFRGGTLCGYSLGARLALGVALAAPELVSRLILISCHPGLAQLEARTQRAADDDALAERLEREGLAAFVDAWERLPLFKTQAVVAAARSRRQREIRLSHAPGPLAQALRALSLGRMPDFTPQLVRLTLPVLCIVGSEDRKFCELGRALQASLPHSTIEVIAGCGHNPLLEAPEHLARSIESFMVGDLCP
jgi:2-succinyl-6-hydroxy-2,4-cyclohexadiene-1-carboxylate synthase